MEVCPSGLIGRNVRRVVTGESRNELELAPILLHSMGELVASDTQMRRELVTHNTVLKCYHHVRMIRECFYPKPCDYSKQGLLMMDNFD